ncbi:hypothetical protein [Burkholderia pseudomallei]|uniref:hypothetical protein n=1 Tax=Burkholderia pseudomallei TaxID=28450 RepID=UPI0009B241DD|nr:hypothetical protein [Burkholderia pseudomallei]
MLLGLLGSELDRYARLIAALRGMALRRVTPQHAASPNADRAPCYAARRRCGLSGGAGGRSVARAMRRAHSPKSFRFVQQIDAFASICCASSGGGGCRV